MLLLLAVLLAQSPRPVEAPPDEALRDQTLRDEAPRRVILDTDMASDCDDAGALAVLHELADRGEATILATVVNRGDRTGRSAAAVDAINTFYRRPDIPIGTSRRRPGPIDPGRSAFVEAVADEFPNEPDVLDSAFPAAADVLAEVLADQPDGSVTICSVGALGNLADLLARDGGAELAAAKVRRLVVMGGGFPRSQRPETNLKLDPVAAVAVAVEWPTPIVWQGFEVGAAVVSGGGLAGAARPNPVRRAFELRPYRGRAAIDGGKPSHDQVAVLLAVRGADALRSGEPVLALSPPGRVAIDSRGHSEWQPQRRGRDRFVSIAGDASELAAAIDRLMADGPAPAE